MSPSKAHLLCSRLEMAARHFRNVSRHMTRRKLANMIRNEIEFRKKRTVLTSLPYFIKVEPSPFCHLRCPGCEHGRSGSGRYSMEMMLTLEGFKKIVEPLMNAVLGVSLSFRGEPLLNPHITDIIAYCRENNIGTEFPTNLSMKLSRERIEELVLSGLDHMIVSIDGITQEVYEKYRAGGSLELVLKNASSLIDAKRRLKSKLPLIEFKYILFEHNLHQKEEAEKLSGNMGFDKFSVVLDNASEASREAMDLVSSANIDRKKPCYWAWNSMTVTWDGTVCACCKKIIEMGNAFETPVNLIWNNERYQRLRSFFATLTPDEISNACMTCMEF